MVGRWFRVGRASGGWVIATACISLAVCCQPKLDATLGDGSSTTAPAEIPTTAPMAAKYDADGPLTASVLEFATLSDPARGQRRVPIKVHVPKQGGPFPVIVFSHGGGGHWDANFAQARHLATHGYAVLCVEHVGSNTQVMKRSLRWGDNLRRMTRSADEVLTRPRDISFAIDRAIEWNQSHPALRGRLDVQRVGVAGHSFGAYTALAVAGARPAITWLTPAVEPAAPGDTGNAANPGLGPSLRDNRVMCIVALSPQGPGEPFFHESSYASLAVPVLGISGSDDQQQQADAQIRRRGFELWPAGQKLLLWLEGADHTAFSDSSGSPRRMLPSKARSDVQPVVRAASVLFFDWHLKGRAEAGTLLTATHLQNYRTGNSRGLELLSK